MMASPAPHPVDANPHASGAGLPPASSSTYGAQTLPIAVPLPDFWHQQQPSLMNAIPYGQHQYQHGVSRAASTTPQYAPSYGHSMTALPSRNTWATSSSASPGRSHHQPQQPSSVTLPVHAAPLGHAQPPYPPQHNQTHSYYASTSATSCYYREPASTDNALPIHHHYPVASTSSAKAFSDQSASVSHITKDGGPSMQQGNQPAARASSPVPSKKASSPARNRGATVEAQLQKSEASQHKAPPSGGPDTPSHQGGEGEDDMDDDPELTARFTSVSEIEAQPTLDPITGEAIYPCPFCDKSYGGKHARSIWRRHLSNKHGIPLNLQPRRTRWDNDANRPKDEAERHKRTLESKRRWAAKNRAEKRAKRKGTTVEEELGLIEAAEAAEAAAGNRQEEEYSLADESFNTSDGSILPTHSAQYQGGHYSYASHQQQRGASYHREAPISRAQHSDAPDLRMSTSHVTYAQQESLQPVYATIAYAQADAGHQPQATPYPAYAVSPGGPLEIRQYQRSPSQPELSTHTRQPQSHMSYTPSVSPVDGSFECQQQQQFQQGQYIQPATMSQPQAQHHHQTGQLPQGTMQQQSASLAQQPFLVPPPTHHAPLLQRSVSAPIPQTTHVRGEHTLRHGERQVDANGVPDVLAPVTYAQHAGAPSQYVNERTSQHLQEAGRPLIGRPTSSTGLKIDIPPPPQVIQGWPQQTPRPDIQQQQQQGSYRIEREQITPVSHSMAAGASVQPTTADNGQSGQQRQQQPPTPYFFLSLPDSTPDAGGMPHVSTVLRPIPVHASMQQQQQQQQPSPSVQPMVAPAPPALGLASSMQQPGASSMIAASMDSKTPVDATENKVKNKVRKETKKKDSTAEGVQAVKRPRKKKTNAPAPMPAAVEEVTIQPKAVQLTKTYQEAAMHLLALASSSPPPSPVKELADPLDGESDEEDEHTDTIRPANVETSLYAEDSGYALSNEGSYREKLYTKYTTREPGEHQHVEEIRQQQQHQHSAEEGEEDEDDTDFQFSRFADVPPSSPAQLRMSLSPDSSPLPLSKGPSKLSATYLRAQASVSGTPLGMKRKYAKHHYQIESGENDENATALSDVERDEHDDDEAGEGNRGEKISLDSSPERGEEEGQMKVPGAKRRFLAMSSVSPRFASGSARGDLSMTGGGGGAMRRFRQSTTTTSTSGASGSPSPSRYTNNNTTSGMSSFATSVIMSTPHQHLDLMGSSQHYNPPSHGKSQAGPTTRAFSSSSSTNSLPVGLGLFSFSQDKDDARKEEDRQLGKNDVSSYSKRIGHGHRSSIFKIDNCSRPSAGLRMTGGGTTAPSSSFSSPSRPFLLSSPEHAAVSKSLGLVPDNFSNNSNTTTGFINLPSDGDGFETHFIRGYNDRHDNGDDHGGDYGGNDGRIGRNGLSEYAKDVFGGFL